MSERVSQNQRQRREPRGSLRTPVLGTGEAERVPGTQTCSFLMPKSLRNGKRHQGNQRDQGVGALKERRLWDSWPRVD